MKVKLKMSRKQLAAVAVAALLIFGLLVARRGGADESGDMDAAASRACSDFAAGYPHATTKASRLALADKVTHSAGQSDNRTIANKATEMGNSAGEGDARWKASADALTGACEAAGWQG